MYALYQIGVELFEEGPWRRDDLGEPLKRGRWKLPATLVGRRDYRLLSHVNRLTDNM